MEKPPNAAAAVPPPREKETTLQKAQRKFTDEPFIPLGTLMTVAFLGAGLRAFHTGESRKAQFLMRGRVLAQGFTVAVFLAGSYFGFISKGERQTMEGKMTVADNKAAAAAAAVAASASGSK